MKSKFVFLSVVSLGSCFLDQMSSAADLNLDGGCIKATAAQLEARAVNLSNGRDLDNGPEFVTTIAQGVAIRFVDLEVSEAKSLTRDPQAEVSSKETVRLVWRPAYFKPGDMPAESEGDQSRSVAPRHALKCTVTWHSTAREGFTQSCESQDGKPKFGISDVQSDLTVTPQGCPSGQLRVTQKLKWETQSAEIALTRSRVVDRVIEKYKEYDSYLGRKAVEGFVNQKFDEATFFPKYFKLFFVAWLKQSTP